MVREFKFDKSYEEVKINDKVYQVEMNDDKILEYTKLFSDYDKEAKELGNLDTDKFDAAQTIDFMTRSRNLTGKVLDGILGEGSFETIYEESGKSLHNVGNLIVFLGEVIAEKSNKLREGNREKYLKNKTMVKEAAKKKK